MCVCVRVDILCWLHPSQLTRLQTFSYFPFFSHSFSQNSVTLSHFVIEWVALCSVFFSLCVQKMQFLQWHWIFFFVFFFSLRFESQCVSWNFACFFWIWFWARVRVRLIPFKGFNRQASENKRKKIDRSFIELLFVVKVFRDGIINVFFLF